jgi:protein-S-isoprenylcysteine O-methyltransferase Ste14
MNIPALAVSIALGIGCGYATLGILSIIGTTALGYRLWWLEVLMAVVVGVLTLWAFSKIANRQTQTPRANSDQRAIWRLAYRKGFELSLEQVVRDTMLNEGTALNALRQLEQNGQAEFLGENRWRLITKG